MLKSLKIKNFCSIGEEQTISLEIKPKDSLDESSCEYKQGHFLNNIACVIGSNASGKTNILKAFSFLHMFIVDSYVFSKTGEPIAINLHKFHLEEPASFEIEFYEDNALYRYYIELNNKQILKERLDKKGLDKNCRWNKAPLFELTRGVDGCKINKYTINKTLHADDRKRIEERNNIAFLSALINLSYLPEITFFKNIETLTLQYTYEFNHALRESSMLAQKLSHDSQLQQDVLSFAKEIDLGISKFAFPDLSAADELIKVKILECEHKVEKGSFKLPIFAESNGTRRSFATLLSIFPILKNGGLIVIDEIEDGLHPYVIKKILSLFANKETNPKNAQIIFSTHQHFLLNDRTKTQIFIANKDNKSLETEIYRLDEVEDVRNDENFFHKYMAGVYGGTPNIKWI